jgi:glutathione synthase/RimK-type ligase-like ATP-grasp enzyme
MVVFPNFFSNWHFNDKVGQKYLLESINAPLVPTYVFFTKKEALEWIQTTTFPKVLKLRGGAASSNVKLVKNQSQAIRLISKAFGRGFRRYSPLDGLKERWRLYRLGRTDLSNCLKGLVRFFVPTSYCRVLGRDRGYIYFQDYIPDNDCDVRILYTFDRCLAFRRMVRQGDFRASGSRVFDYEQSNIPKKTLQIAFEVAQKLKIQTAAFDFIINKKEPLLLEISYASGPSPEQNDHGFYEKDLSYHKVEFDPNDWIVEGVIKQIENNIKAISKKK